MKTLRKLHYVAKLMTVVNETQCHEVFMDIKVDEIEEEIVFDMMVSQSHHAMDLCRLLNLTYYPVAYGDKIIHSILP